MLTSYLMKMYAGLTYAVVFWVLALAVQHYQAAFLHSEYPGMNPPFWDNFGLSCISNVLMGALYLVVYTGDIAFRKLYCNAAVRHRASMVEIPEQTTAHGSVFCVEEEDHDEQQQQAQSSGLNSGIEMPREKENDVTSEGGLITLRVTPALLWYYMYTTGWGVFCMAYTLHGAHWVSSLCLCGGTLLCGTCGALRDGKQVNNKKKLLVIGLLLVLNVASLCMCVAVLSNNNNHQGLLWRSWVVEIACPLLAPFWLWESKHKMIPMNMPQQSMVMFGLPFTSMISAGYLSMYIPLQECATSSTMSSSSSKSSITNSTLLLQQAERWTPLITQEGFMGQSGWALFLCGIGVPGLMYAGFVLYTSAFQKAEMQLMCANSLWMVFTARLWMYVGDGFGSAAVMGLLGWFLALWFVLLHHMEMNSSSSREWQDIYGDILLVDDDRQENYSNDNHNNNNGV